MAVSNERIVTLVAGLVGALGIGGNVYQAQAPCDCTPALAACEERNDDDCKEREREIRDFCIAKLRAD